MNTRRVTHLLDCAWRGIVMGEGGGGKGGGKGGRYIRLSNLVLFFQ